jgi:hypothetical protein
MRRSIDFAGAHAPSIDRRMAAEITEIAPAQSAQQIEIHYDSRLFADSLNFEVIFLARQAIQPLTPRQAFHPLQQTLRSILPLPARSRKGWRD